MLRQSVNVGLSRGRPGRWTVSSANARHIIYPIVASAFFGFDVTTWINDASAPLTDVAASAVIAAMTILAAWRSVVGSAGIVLVSCLVIVSPFGLFGSIFTPFLIVLAIAEQISRRQFALATISAFLLAGAYLLDPTVRSTWALMMAVLFQLLLAIPLGLAMLFHDRQVDALEREVAEVAKRTRAQLALALHDTAITDLTRALVITRTLRSRANEPRTSDIGAVEESIVAALRSLRQTAKIVDSSAKDEMSSVCKVVREMSNRLTIRHLAVECSCADDATLNRTLGDVGHRFVQLFLKEALINCLKYADEGTTIVISSEESDSHIEVFVRSVAVEGSDARNVEEYSSGLGIAGIRTRARALGGDVSAGKVFGYWMISLHLPRIRESGGERDE